MIQSRLVLCHLLTTLSSIVQLSMQCPIGLYRDVWIAAIARSRTSLATQSAAICVHFQGRRVCHVYVTMQITYRTRKSTLIYRWGLRQRVASLTLYCNGIFVIKAYGQRSFAYSAPSTWNSLLLCHVYVTMQITYRTRKSTLIYRWGLRQRVASLTLYCNGIFVIKAYGQRSFAYSAPSTWNSLPRQVHSSDSVSTLRSRTKTHLFHLV